MTKRMFDIVFSLLVLIATAPLTLSALFLVWRQDGHSPLYKARRVGRDNRDFVMIKIRSMRINADRSGVTSTSTSDGRITKVGRFIRRYKLDEVSQFWNVLRGDMSVVGPRPNTRLHGVDEYTALEMKLLSPRPGITDLSSIVFSDEGEILTGANDPDALYNRIIRPWKSSLGLLYIENRSLKLDLQIVWLTAVALVSKDRALEGIADVLNTVGADATLKQICRRQEPLPAGLPPGSEMLA